MGSFVVQERVFSKILENLFRLKGLHIFKQFKVTKFESLHHMQGWASPQIFQYLRLTKIHLRCEVLVSPVGCCPPESILQKHVSFFFYEKVSAGFNTDYEKNKCAYFRRRQTKLHYLLVLVWDVRCFTISRMRNYDIQHSVPRMVCMGD